MNVRMLITAAIAVVLYVALFEEAVQFFAAEIAGAGDASLALRKFYLIADLEFSPGFSPLASIIILAAPVISEIVIIESGLVIIKKIPMNALRHTVIITVLLLSGYLLIYIFYSGFSVILNFNQQNDFVRIADLAEGSENSRIIFIIFAIVIIAVYLNSVIKRILNYINL